MAKCVECGGNISYVTKDILKCEYCGKLYSEIDGNLTSANQASIYETAVIKSQSTNPETLEEAIELFSILGSYKNSGSLEYQCRNQIHQNKIAQEEKRLEERRQAELAEKAYKVQKEKDAQIRKAKLIAIATIIGFVVIVGTIIGVSKHSKNVKYENAVNLYEQGHYEEAMEAFEKMGDYKDAKSQVESIRNQIQVRKNTYEQGIAYYNSGAYAEAIQQLQEVADYEDTADYLEQASSILYQQAQDAVNNGDYKLAQEKITAIPEGYSISTQAKTLLVEIDQKVAEQERVENYAQAVSYYDDGQYDLAQPLFIGLEDYSNSKEYLNNIGTNFYTQASEQIEAGNLEAAVQKLTLIDEATEWENYQSAIDLKENTIASYKENIKIKAAMKEKYGTDIVNYHHREPDFTPFEHEFTNERINDFMQQKYGTEWENIKAVSEGNVQLEHMDTKRNGGTFSQASDIVAEKLGISREDVDDYMKANNLTWHECGDRHTVRAIPSEINQAFGHTGGIGLQQDMEAMAENIHRMNGDDITLKRDFLTGDTENLGEAISGTQERNRAIKKELFK